MYNSTQKRGMLYDLWSTSCFHLLPRDPLELRPKTHKSGDEMQYYGYPKICF
jgi:hypothetical protein